MEGKASKKFVHLRWVLSASPSGQTNNINQGNGQQGFIHSHQKNYHQELKVSMQCKRRKNTEGK